MELSEIFYWLLSMSITAIICTVPVLITRCISKIPKNIIRHLWIISFIRLVFPFGLPSEYGLMELTAKLTRTVAVPVNAGDDAIYLTYNHIALAQKYVPFTWKTDMIRRAFDVASVIWVIIATGIFFLFAFTYIKTFILHRNAEKSRGNIRYSNVASSPFLLGIIRPRIILPYNLKGKDNRLVILHEQSHIYALDNLSRLLAIFVCIIHWFNPLVWIFLRLYLCDIECACDERVIKNNTDKQKKEYALMLVEAGKTHSATFSGFISSGLAKRINVILSYKKLSFAALVFVICLFAAIGYILLSNGEVSGIQ